MISEKTKYLANVAAEHLNGILDTFSGENKPKVTLLIRYPDDPEGYFLMINDDINEVISLLQKQDKK